MAISSRDYRSVIELIDTIHSVPDNSAMFRSVCEKLQKQIGFYSGVFAYTDPKSGAFRVDGCDSFHNSNGALVLYLSHYWRLDPYVTSGWFFSNRFNVAARNVDLVPEKELARSEFACDFLLPIVNVFYIIAATLASQGDAVARVGFHRQKREGNFSDRDMEIINILLPHMARAIRNRNLMNGVEISRDTAGVIVIGEDGSPFYTNDEARKILRGIPAGSIPDPGLSSSPALIHTRAGTYQVRTMPLGNSGKGKVIFLERHPPEDRLQAKLADSDLSRREREIAVHVVQGYSNREIAERLFIAEQTVKDHLHSVFDKLAIRRRGELTARILGLRSGNILM